MTLADSSNLLGFLVTRHPIAIALESFDYTLTLDNADLYRRHSLVSHSNFSSLWPIA